MLTVPFCKLLPDVVILCPRRKGWATKPTCLDRTRARVVLQGNAAGDKTKQLKDMIKALPQHQEKMQKFGMHLDMSSKINTAFSRKVGITVR